MASLTWETEEQSRRTDEHNEWLEKHGTEWRAARRLVLAQELKDAEARRNSCIHNLTNLGPSLPLTSAVRRLAVEQHTLDKLNDEMSELDAKDETRKRQLEMRKQRGY